MPKKPMTTINKIRIVLRWVFKDKHGLTTTCGECGSTRVVRLDYEDSEHIYKDGTPYKRYKARYECKNCEALGVNTETWAKLEDLQPKNGDDV